MIDLLNNLGINVAANVVTAIIIGLLGIVFVTRSRGRDLKDFFGFEPGTQLQQRIYLSTIAVQPKGTRGTSEIREGFYGDGITEIEYRHAFELAAIFANRSPSWVLATILGVRSASENIIARIEMSPSYRHYTRNSQSNDVEYDLGQLQRELTSHKCAILVGGPIYNLLTHHVLRPRGQSDKVQPYFEFVRGNGQSSTDRGIRALRKTSDRDYIRKNNVNGNVRDYFIVEKITIERTKVFICAGTCTSATAAAVDRLRTYWKEYRRIYGDKDFGALYRIEIPVRASDVRESDPSSPGVEVSPECAFPSTT